jgi:hypothetical protein
MGHEIEIQLLICTENVNLLGRNLNTLTIKQKVHHLVAKSFENVAIFETDTNKTELESRKN